MINLKITSLFQLMLTSIANSFIQNEKIPTRSIMLLLDGSKNDPGRIPGLVEVVAKLLTTNPDFDFLIAIINSMSLPDELPQLAEFCDYTIETFHNKSLQISTELLTHFEAELPKTASINFIYFMIQVVIPLLEQQLSSSHLPRIENLKTAYLTKLAEYLATESICLINATTPTHQLNTFDLLIHLAKTITAIPFNPKLLAENFYIQSAAVIPFSHFLNPAVSKKDLSAALQQFVTMWNEHAATVFPGKFFEEVMLPLLAIYFYEFRSQIKPITQRESNQGSLPLLTFHEFQDFLNAIFPKQGSFYLVLRQQYLSYVDTDNILDPKLAGLQFITTSLSLSNLFSNLEQFVDTQDSFATVDGELVTAEELLIELTQDKVFNHLLSVTPRLNFYALIASSHLHYFISKFGILMSHLSQRVQPLFLLHKRSFSNKDGLREIVQQFEEFQRQGINEDLIASLRGMSNAIRDFNQRNYELVLSKNLVSAVTLRNYESNRNDFDTEVLDKTVSALKELSVLKAKLLISDNTELLEANIELVDTNTKLLELNQALTEQNREQIKARDDEQNQNKTLQKNNAVLQTKLTKQKDDHAKLSARIAVLEKELETAKQTIADKDAKIARHKQTISEYEEANKEFAVENNTLQSTADNLEDKNKQLTKILKEKEQSIQDLRRNNQDYVRANSLLSTQLKELGSKLELHLKDCEDLIALERKKVDAFLAQRTIDTAEIERLQIELTGFKLAPPSNTLVQSINFIFKQITQVLQSLFDLQIFTSNTPITPASFYELMNVTHFNDTQGVINSVSSRLSMLQSIVIAIRNHELNRPTTATPTPYSHYSTYTPTIFNASPANADPPNNQTQSNSAAISQQTLTNT